MQIQHEARLLEPTPAGSDSSQHFNKSLDAYCLLSRFSWPLNPIENLASCSTSGLLACHLQASNQILLHDTSTCKRRDRFPLKACDKRFSKQSFSVSGLDFSQDGQRLAVSQSDCVIYIYKLAAHLGQPSGASQPLESNLPTSGSSPSAASTAAGPQRPTISGKFASSSPVNCLLWTDLGILFGTQDGKVKLIQMGASSRPPEPTGGANQQAAVISGPGSSPTRVLTIYSSPRGSMPLALAYKSPLLVVGLADNSLQVLLIQTDQVAGASASLQNSPTVAAPAGNDLQANLSTPGSRRSSSSQLQPSVVQSTSVQHSCLPDHLSILAAGQTSTICCAGADGRLALYGAQTNPLRVSLVQSIDLRESIMSMDYSQVNELLVLATRQRLLFLKQDPANNNTHAWRLQSASIELAGASLNSTRVAITKVVWTSDGAQLAVGLANGSVELFRCQWSKQALGDQLEICHIAKNRVRITDRERNLLATYKSQAEEIKRVNLLEQGQSVIIWTSSSLLLARLGCQQQSEISWPMGDLARSAPKFLFDPSGFVLIYNQLTRELQVVKLGKQCACHSVQLPSNVVKRNLVAVRQFPALPTRGSAADRSANGSSPSRQRSAAPRSHRSSSAAALAALQQAATDAETPPADRLTVAELSPSQLPPESQSERFVHLTDTGLVLIDLKDPKRRAYPMEHEKEVLWLDLSHSGSWLAFRDAASELWLVEISLAEPSEGEQEEMGRLKITKSHLLSHCPFACWLPETDSLVAQTRPKIIVWFEPSERNKSLELDSRSFNPTRAPPLLDLSLLPSGRHAHPLVLGLASLAGDQLRLSNGQLVQLDRIRLRFQALLLAGRLEAALELLEQPCQPFAGKDAPTTTSSNRSLVGRLAWLALEQGNCQMALKAFAKINYRKLCQFLSSNCLGDKSREEEEVADQDQDQDQGRLERELSMAKLRGDWALFESLSDSDPERIVSTYKRLNKWSRLLDYLSRCQQFRQRDLAEREQIAWLVARGRHLEAARLQARASGDLIGALELLMSHSKLPEAVELFLAEQLRPLPAGAAALSGQLTREQQRRLELAKRLLGALVEGGEHLWAARLSERILGDLEGALELYLGAEDLEAALRVASASNSKRLNEIEASYGLQLAKLFRANRLSRRRTLPAIGHLLAAGRAAEALELALELRDFDRAYEVIKRIAGERQPDGSDVELRERCELVSEKMIGLGRLEEACELLDLGGNHERLVELLIEMGQLGRALRISVDKVEAGDEQRARERFLQLAERMALEEEASRVVQAEQIYLLLERPEPAIEMHRRRGSFDRMLELIGQFRGDQLETSLLQLARQLEAEGRLEEAERYLLRASPSEWTSVVRMYRLANRWPEAFRVAQANCAASEDPLLVQLAYWWAKSLLADEGRRAARQLLGRLGLFRQVVEFAGETKNFPLALDLLPRDTAADEDQPDELAQLLSLRREVVRRFASHLEGQSNFAKAEEVLVANDCLELAVRMYIDNERPNEAVRLVEQQLGALAGASSAGAGGLEAEEAAQQVVPTKREQLVVLLNETLVQCATRLADESSISSSKRPLLVRPSSRNSANGPRSQPPSQLEKLLMAQQMFLRAQRPELAVSMYQSRGMWREAIQVAQRFAPQLLEAVEQALDEQADLGPDLRAQLPSGGQRAEPLVEGPAPIPSEQQVAQEAARPVQEDRQAEAALLRGDRKMARQAITRLLDQLEAEQRPEELEKRLARLERIAQVAARTGSLVVLASQESQGRICALADRWLLSVSDRPALRMRNLLALALEAALQLETATGELTGPPRPIGGAPSGPAERRLLVAHFVALLAALGARLREQLAERPVAVRRTRLSDSGPPPGAAGGARTGGPAIELSVALAERLSRSRLSESLVGLAASVSLALLRYVALLEPAGALYSAGLWQLAAGRRRLARTVWSYLVDLEGRREGLESSQSAPGSRAALARLVDLPAREAAQLGGLTEGQLAEVRQWLLEALISGDDEPEQDANYPKTAGSSGHLSAICMASGLPVAETERLVLGERFGRSFEVHPDQWRRLLELAGRRWRPHLNGSTASEGPPSANQDSSSAPEAGGATTTARSAGGQLGEVVDFLAHLSGSGDAA